jgi:hypothetical protein
MEAQAAVSFWSDLFEHIADVAYPEVSTGRYGKRSTILNKYRENLCEYSVTIVTGSRDTRNSPFFSRHCLDGAWRALLVS